MAANPDTVARIDAITRNARNTWFALLSLELFIAITLMRVEHVDFYGVDRATQLPVLNIGVPTFLFFYAAPVLLTATFGFFHLYLIRLWDALSIAPARVNGHRLGDAIAPWLVNDAALHLRHVLRRDFCTVPRALDWTSTLLTFALNWGLGLFVIGAIWWVSMPARDIYMTGIAGACVLACLFIGSESALRFYRRMKEARGNEGLSVHARLPNPVKALAFTLSLAGLSFLTYARTMEPAGGLAFTNPFYRGTDDSPATWLASVAMPNEAIAQRPPGWLPYHEARLDYLATWCRREGLTCSSSDPFPEGFADAWRIRRDAAIAEQLKPHWHKTERKPNWADANLAGAYLTGVNLNGAKMQRANLRRTQMEGANLIGVQMKEVDLFSAQMARAILSRAHMEQADLRKAQMQGAVLSFAKMQGADLSGAQLQGTVLSRARLQGAQFRDAQMQRADLAGAQMANADLRRVQMQRANLRDAQMVDTDLRGAQLQGADFSGAQMQGANLYRAKMEGTNLFAAQMQKANLSRSSILGSAGEPVRLSVTNLNASLNSGGAMRFLDMSGALWDEKTDFRNAFMDATVTLPPGFRTRMGNPCQWLGEALSDTEYVSVWAWWLDMLKTNIFFFQLNLRDLPRPTPERLAELGLTDCRPGQPFGPMPDAAPAPSGD